MDSVHIDAAMKHDKLIEEESVECRPEKVSDAVADENVDVSLVRQFFTEDAWKIVRDVVDTKVKNMSWKCHCCFNDLHAERSIICDGCLLWFHFQCVSLTTQPKAKTWFCRKCHTK